MNHLQNVLLDILSDIDALMKENNVKYFLDGGTALGAIRHKGFIPWDDDVDIVVLPEDKEKFDNVCHNKLDKIKYTFVEAHKDWPFLMSKIKLNGTHIEEKDAYPEDNQGIYIDVFYFDYARSSKLGQYWQYLCGRLFTAMLLTYKPYNTNSLIKKVALKMGYCFRCRPFKNWLHKQVRNQSKCDTLSEVWDRTRSNWTKYFIPKEYFNEMVLVDFEGKKFPVCKDYDLYLKQLYGDYMKLPPEEKRVGLHILNVDFGIY